MGSIQKYNEAELAKIEGNLKWLILKEVILCSAIFASVTFIILSYSVPKDTITPESLASITLGISYGADTVINSIAHYFG